MIIIIIIIAFIIFIIIMVIIITITIIIILASTRMEVDFNIERSIFQNLYVEDLHTSVFMLAKALITINGSSSSSGMIDENISTHDGDSSHDDYMRSSSSSGMKEQSLLKLNPSLRR